MAKKSPEELDKMFQQEPEQYPFEYNAASWKQMEKLFDEDDRRRLFWWWFVGIGALLLIGWVWFFGKNKTKATVSNSEIEKTENLNSSKENFITKQFQDSISNKKNTIETNSISNPKNSPTSNSLEATPNFSKNQNSKNTQQYIYKNSKPILKSNHDNLFLEKTESEFPISSDSIFEKNNLAIDSVNFNESILEDKKLKSEHIFPSKVSVAPIAFLDFFIQKNQNPKTHNITFTEDSILVFKRKNTNQFLFGFVVGGETSKVKQSNFSKLNWRIGGQIEYRFLQKWSTSIGANFIKKRYAAVGSAYHPPAGFWDGGTPPQSLDADCNILETPINIGFFPKKYMNNGFYANLGLTSFFMLREQYDYFYALPSPDQIPNWVGKNKNRHWWSIGEFSIGYQKYLSRKMIVQFAPYLQIPLKGVGHGKVKLWSTGVNVKFNFQVNN